MKIINTLLSIAQWRKHKYQPPVPYDVKLRTLEMFNLQNSTWVETGTFKGDTTIFLSKISKKVFTIEASQELYASAQKKFNKENKIKSIYGRSQNELPKILENIAGNVCFWLDAHYCGPKTFSQDTFCPILFELKTIISGLSRFNNVNILIDDIRDFSSDRNDYPDKNKIIQLSLPHFPKWEIINDILILQRVNPQSSLS